MENPFTFTCSLGATTTAADDDPIYNEFTCSPENNYTDKSPHAKNLAELLSVLTTVPRPRRRSTTNGSAA
jgi:hypothetical protein